MIGSLFRSRKKSRPQRPSFRPALESLESREVPTSAQVSAAFHALPGDVTTLRTSVMTPNNPTFNNDLRTVINDVAILHFGAPGFITGDRLRIDNALFVNGLRMIFNGFSALNVNNQTQPLEVIGVGESAAISGLTDSLIVGLFPNSSSGTAVLT
jgi:hypothetical protein